MKVGVTICQNDIVRVKCASHDSTAKNTRKPNDVTTRASKRSRNMPTSMEKTSARMPSGATVNPAWNAVYPITVCSQSGKMTPITEKLTIPSEMIATTHEN